MSGDDRRRIRSANAIARRRKSPGRVGEPNVLSNAATPNTLSAMATGPANVTPSPRTAAPGQAGWLSTGTTAPRQRVGLPSFGTLIFLAFLAFTGLRLAGEFVRGLDEETSAPNQAVVPGSVVFGTKSDGDCGVLETSHDFVEGAEVWWSARLDAAQTADAEVVVLVLRDGIEIDREVVPGDAEFGTWSVLCSGSPVKETRAGLYQVEIWDAAIGTRHATGEYRLTPG
jgi:hypothetical protein